MSYSHSALRACACEPFVPTLFASPYVLSAVIVIRGEPSLATPRNYDIPTSGVTGQHSASELRSHIT